MGISLSDLGPKARAQAEKKLLAALAEKKTAPQKENKYHAEKDTRGDLQFDSRREARRWDDLCLMEKGGQIENLRRQVPFELVPKQIKPDGKAERAVKYIADFVYEKDGQTVVEDSKGRRTPDYVIKRKLMLWVHGIAIKEV